MIQILSKVKIIYWRKNSGGKISINVIIT